MYQEHFENDFATQHQEDERTGNASALMQRLAAPPMLFQAWRKVRANQGAPGSDAVSLRQFERNLSTNLHELSRNLLHDTYEPLPARYVRIPKDNGKLRELAIPAVRDRVAQRAVLDVIEGTFERQFLDCSYAFRPGRSVEIAVQNIIVARAQGYRWTVEADIQDFFPAIDHQLLRGELEAAIPAADVCGLIQRWLEAGVLDGTKPNSTWRAHWRETLASWQLTASDAVNHLLDDFVGDRLGIGALGAGDALRNDEIESPAKTGLGRTALRHLAQNGVLLAIAERAALRGLVSAKVLGLGGAAVALSFAVPPLLRKVREMNTRDTGALQGAPISPLLSNAYLHPFDVAMTGQGFRLVRYCDDFVVLCASEQEARTAYTAVEKTLRHRRLTLNPAKTRIVPPTEAFAFLGHQFTPDGRVSAPATIPAVVQQRVAQFAAQEWARAQRHAQTAGDNAQTKAQQWTSRLSRLRKAWDE